MSASHEDRSVIVYIIMSLLVLLGVTAIGGGIMLMLDPSGSLLQADISLLHAVPVDDFFFPGLILFSVFGLLPLIVVYGIWKQPDWRFFEKINLNKGYHWSRSWTRIIAVLLLLWVGLEFLMWGMASPFIPIYGGLALALIILSDYDSVKRYQRAQ